MVVRVKDSDLIGNLGVYDAKCGVGKAAEGARQVALDLRHVVKRQCRIRSEVAGRLWVAMWSASLSSINTYYTRQGNAFKSSKRLLTVTTSQTAGLVADCLYPVTCTVQACAGPALPCSADESLHPNQKFLKSKLSTLEFG